MLGFAVNNIRSSLAAMPKFCANLSFLFKEKPLLERYAAAKNAGFHCVESGFPFGFTKEQVVDAKNSAGIEQLLINSLTGDVTKGELGFAAIPGKEKEFLHSIKITIDYAKALGAQKIHIMSGKITEGGVTKAHDTAYISNLRNASSLLQQANILGVIEPINRYSIPKYYMNSYEKAIEVIKTINSPNIRLQLDIFHLQLIKGDISHTIDEVKPFIGHVQVAQAPNRGEPDSAGEINYKYVFEALEKSGYNDWIGLEYNPINDTVNGLKWVKDFGFSL
ncbi:putative hydroxypyruvate isomerase isoform X2 [Euwallacea fornicatus]|uniref:putative hydroxypyruvate isomerase isoform X2 n=1 Tax=Euwallacea fornicatus TaxID=995702 RepID=UPI00338F4DBC